MSIYIILVASVLVFGQNLGEDPIRRKRYILVMALLHTCICGLRYAHLTGDLMNYHDAYLRLADCGWLDDLAWQGGRNVGFHWLMKVCVWLFGGEFQPFLFLLAAFQSAAVAWVIARFCPDPRMGYLVWNCLGFYIFGFSAIKQAAAMAVILLSFPAIAEKKPGRFLALTLLAGFLHTPALVFLPAYILCRTELRPRTLMAYLASGILLFLLRKPLAAWLVAAYYPEADMVLSAGMPGNRFWMMVGFCLMGILFRGFRNARFRMLFHLMAVAALLQLFGGFSNLFTRLADYYFQFSILYLPAIFLPEARDAENPTHLPAVFSFNRRSRKILAGILAVFLIWFYWTYNLNITIPNPVDNYLNYRTMWYRPTE